MGVFIIETRFCAICPVITPRLGVFPLEENSSKLARGTRGRNDGSSRTRILGAIDIAPQLTGVPSKHHWCVIIAFVKGHRLSPCRRVQTRFITLSIASLLPQRQRRFSPWIASRQSQTRYPPCTQRDWLPDFDIAPAIHTCIRAYYTYFARIRGVAEDNAIARNRAPTKSTLRKNDTCSRDHTEK